MIYTLPLESRKYTSSELGELLSEACSSDFQEQIHAWILHQISFETKLENHHEVELRFSDDCNGVLTVIERSIHSIHIEYYLYIDLFAFRFARIAFRKDNLMRPLRAGEYVLQMKLDFRCKSDPDNEKKYQKVFSELGHTELAMLYISKVLLDEHIEELFQCVVNDENLLEHLKSITWLTGQLLDDLISESLAQNPKAISSIIAGKEKAIGAIVGPIMKKASEMRKSVDTDFITKAIKDYVQIMQER